MKTGEKIRELRKKCGISQEELAGRIGVSRRSLINYEQGDSFPTKPEVITALAEAFGITTDELLGDAAAESLNVNAAVKAERSAQELVDAICDVFRGSKLSSEGKDAAMCAISDAYWQAKKKSGSLSPEAFRSNNKKSSIKKKK